MSPVHPTKPLYRIALLICVLAISYLAFAPLEQPPGPQSDKLNHLLAFAVLAWLADRSFPGSRLAPYRWSLLLGYGLMIELIQGFLPFRELSVLDFAANLAGILTYDVALLIRRRARPRRLLNQPPNAGKKGSSPSPDHAPLVKGSGVDAGISRD